MGRLKLMLAGCGVVVFWAIFSIGLVLYGSFSRGAMANSMKTVLSALFEYQTRYDAVFEMAYPEKGAGDLSQMVPTAPASDIVPADSQANPVTNVASTEKPLPAPTVSPSPPPVSGAPSNPIVIERVVVDVAGTQLSITVDMRNKDNPTKAEGAIWMAAKLQSKDGRTHYYGWPAQVSVRADGTASAPQGAIRYSIRNFKSQQVTLDLPSSASGQLVDVKVVLKDKSGKETIHVSPVGKPVGKS